MARIGHHRDVIEEVVAVRSKMYSVLSKKNIRKAKGVKKNVIEKEITHEHYKEALFGRRQFMHKMKILRSEGHEMYGMCMNKISISPFDTKRWIADDGIQTLAYGHFRLAAAEYKAAQPTALHERSRAWDCQTNNRQQADLAWSYFQQPGRLSKTSWDLSLF